MNTEDIKYFAIVILLGLSVLSTIILQSYMKTGYAIPLVIIFITIILMTGTIFGLWIEEPWGYSIATILFTGTIIHTGWIFYKTNMFLPFTFALLVNVAGIVISITQKLNEYPKIETYEIPKYETYETEEPKKKRKYTRRK